MNYILGVVLQLAGVCWIALILCRTVHEIMTESKGYNTACHEATKELAYPAVLLTVALLYLIICAVSDITKHM